MATKLNSILLKKGYTGKELGQLELKAMCHAHRQAILHPDKDVEPLFDKAEFRKLIDGLEYDQAMVFNAYIAVHQWLAEHYGGVCSQLHQAEGHIRSLSDVVMVMMIGEQTRQAVNQSPVIMTEKQYNDFREQRFKEILTNERVNARPADRVFQAFEAVLDAGEDSKTLQAIKKKMMAKPVTSKRVIENYAKEYGWGYYMMPNGLRSDEVSKEEWKKAVEKACEVTTELWEKLLGRPCKTAWDKNHMKGMLINHVAFDRGISTHEAEKIVEAESGYRAEWHTYEGIPDNLNQWDVARELVELTQIYTKFIGSDFETIEEFTAELEEFKNDFPDLFLAVEQEMVNTFKDLKGKPYASWCEREYTPQELFDMDALGYRKQVHADIFKDGSRGRVSGVAIIQPDTGMAACFVDDKTGYYMDIADREFVRNTFKSFDITNYYYDNENYASDVALVKRDREGFLASYAYVSGFNTAVEILAERFDLPELLTTLKLTGLDGKVDAFNGLVTSLNAMFDGVIYGELVEERDLKRTALRDHFGFIELDDIKPSEHQVKFAKGLLKRITDFSKNADAFTDATLLFSRGKKHDNT